LDLSSGDTRLALSRCSMMLTSSGSQFMPTSDMATGREVSVVAPTRNCSHLLAPTLRGVLRQRDVVLDVVVVDDASNAAETAELVAGFNEDLRRTDTRWNAQARSCAPA
jgi:hypothetical protein